jgi:hypothetical protein
MSPFPPCPPQLRSIAARTKRTLITAIGTALRGITSADATAWLTHAGYRNTQM